MRITLAGDLGSGKSSVGRRLSGLLDVPHFSAGSLFREIGQISNLDALQTNLAAEDNTEIDHAVDRRTVELNRLHESFVIDSRMAWHFVENATRVYLSASPQTAAERVARDASRAGEAYTDTDAALASLAQRRDSEVRRYKKLYGVDITDPGNYDLVIITDDAAVDDVADIVLRFARGEIAGKYWIPKKRIVPLVAAPASDGAASVAEAAMPLRIEENFGLYEGDAVVLLHGLRTPTRFVTYVLTTGNGASIAAAKKKLTPAGLDSWERASGITLAFSRCLSPTA